MPDIDDLQFVRTYDFRYIPRELFEQTKEADADTIDRIYKFGDSIAASPLTLLYVMINKVNKIKGVLWATIDVVDAIIFIKALSVDKEYQLSCGRTLEKVKEFMFGLNTGPELKKEIHFLATKPNAYEKTGAICSNRILMEITNVDTKTKV